MKSLLTISLILISINSSIGQNFGISMSFSTEKVFAMDFFYGKDANRFHFGFGKQSNGQKNTVVRERKSNYGLTKIEDGDFFWIIDLGYSRIIKEKVTIHPEISLGGKNEFTS